MRNAVIIGSGFSGLSAASILAKEGWNVTVLERHNLPGGRARQFSEKGFVFDMGPSWYWMPDVFERFFGLFGKKVSDYYNLRRLDPSYKVFWSEGSTELPAEYTSLSKVFESLETGSAKKLNRFLEEAKYKYEVGINKLVHKPGRSVFEFLDLSVIKGVFKLAIFNSIKQHVSKFFSNKKVKQLLEFPVLFLGALPENTPALYSLMNYADIKLGTWYPDGGIYEVVAGFHRLAVEHGVDFKFGHDVTGFDFDNDRITAVNVIEAGVEKSFKADIVISSADYHFVETNLLPKELQSYNKKYWDSRKMAPSCLIYYIGLSKKLANAIHHMLFFDVDFELHADEIYKETKWPTNPLFYVSATSVTDDSTAPRGCENLFFLIPVASGLTTDNQQLREKYLEIILDRFEKRIGENVKDFIVMSKNFGPSDFVNDYGAFKGNAYGLANTLLQTAILKPKCKSKKVKNLYYAGQLTVPGPGVPPSIISGEVVAKEAMKNFKNII
ncbi:MAG: phytoene desaturase family protein [Ginsengibacter sp.]